jgi:hypothetical protein
MAGIDRFSRLYGARGVAAQDNPRARKRVTAALTRMVNDRDYRRGQIVGTATALINEELGAEIGDSPYATLIERYLHHCSIPDFLDAITILYLALKVDDSDKGRVWLAFVGRVFDEENLCYRLDENGVVHFRVDEEYETNVASLIGSLDGARFGAARDAFQRARDDMAKPKPDLIDATRALFESAESLFKTITGSSAKLDAGEVKKTLVPYVDKKMRDADSIAKGAAGKMAMSFAAWVDSCHPYRHGHEAQEPIAPTVEFAVMLMSTGAGYIRWLATLDQAPLGG